MHEKEQFDKVTCEDELFYAITGSISKKTMTEATAQGMLAASMTHDSIVTICQGATAIEETALNLGARPDLANDRRKASHGRNDDTTSTKRIDIVTTLIKGGARMRTVTLSGIPAVRQMIQPAFMRTPLLIHVTWPKDMFADHASTYPSGNMWRPVYSYSSASADQEQQALRRLGSRHSLLAGVGQDPAHHRAVHIGPAVTPPTQR